MIIEKTIAAVIIPALKAMPSLLDPDAR